MKSDTARIAALYRYPLKSARGQELAEAVLSATGLEHDREWLLVSPQGKFITQREVPQLALLTARASRDELVLSAAESPALPTLPTMPELRVARDDHRLPCRVQIWRDPCAAFDAGDAAALALSAWLGRECRLVRFDAAQRRVCNPAWTGGSEFTTAFADGYPLLLVNQASLDELNRRLVRPLPVERFRPNLVIEGLEPYAEDHLSELWLDDIVLRVVKPCERCVITTTDQTTGKRDGDEPLRTLRTYRYDAALHGVTFGQNVVVVSGVGARLRCGANLSLRWRQ